MLGALGLWRSVVRRMLADWTVTVAATILLVAATGLLATGALYGDTVALGGVSRSIAAAAPIDRGVLLRTPAARDAVEVLAPRVAAELRAALAAADGDVALVARSGAMTVVGDGPGDADGDGSDRLTAVASFEAIEAHAALVGGAWPGPGRTPVEAALSEGAAAALGLEIGDEVVIASRRDPSRTATIVVAGIWRPDRGDPYWFAEPLDLIGESTVGPFTTRGPFVVALPDLVATYAAGDLELTWRGLPSAEAVGLDEIAPLAAALAQLPDRLRPLVPAGQSIAMTTGLPALLATIDRAVLVSRAGVLVLTLQFAVLAGYAIVLVAGMIVDRRRADQALLRARGAGTRQVAGMAILEAALTALPAAILAPWLAVLAVRGLATWGPLAGVGVASVDPGPGVVVVAILAAAACAVALAVPAITSSAAPSTVRQARGRQSVRTLAQRVGLDLVVIVVAGIALWQLQFYGSPITRDARGVLGIDPLLVAAPAIGLLAGALLALRIIPRLAEIAERLFGRRPGLVSSLGSRQIARRPGRYARAGLLLMLAVALGMFGAAYGATWTRSQADQAAWQAVSDVRLVGSTTSRIAGWGAGSAVRRTDGVVAAVPVVREPLDVGRALRGAPLLALNPGGLAAISGPRDGLDPATAARLAAVAAERPPSAGIVVSGEPARLAVVVDADLAAVLRQPDEDPVPPWQTIDTSIVVEDVDGRIHRIDGGRGLSTGSGQRIEVPLARVVDGVAVAPSYPIRIRAIELRLIAPNGVAAAGSVSIAALAASDDAVEGGWRAIPFDAAAPGWAWRRIDGGFDAPALVDEADPARVLIGAAVDHTDAIFGSPTFPGSVFRLWLRPAPPPALPAVVGERFLAATAAQVGDTLAVSIRGLRVEIEVVDVLPLLAPNGIDDAFVVVDAPTLDLVRLDTTGQTTPATEWWIAVQDGVAPAVAAALARSPLRPDGIVDRGEVVAALTEDPVALGVVGALLLGSVAALLFATIGYLVNATVSAAERANEFTILRALGVSGRQVSAWLALEHAFLLAFGVIAGLGLGIGLAWLVLPSATFTATGARVVPPAAVEVPLVTAAGLAGLALVLLVGAVLVAGRQVAAARIGDVLRSGEV